MSLAVLDQSIKVGETTTLLLNDVINPNIQQNNSIMNIEQSENNSYIITVNPTISTIYYISGYNSTQMLINLNATVYVNVTPLKMKLLFNIIIV